MDAEPVRYPDEFYKASLMIACVGATTLGGFCGCGSDAEYGLVYHLLKAIDGQVEEPDECIRAYMRPHSSKEPDEAYRSWGFPHTPLSEFLVKFLDAGGLTEHGTTVVWPWISRKGAAYLKAIDVCVDIYCEIKGLDKDEMREGPFGFSKFDASLFWTDDETYMPKWASTLEQYLVTDCDIAQYVAYMLFMGDAPDYWHCVSDEIKEKTDGMLNEILRLMEEER